MAKKPQSSDIVIKINHFTRLCKLTPEQKLSLFLTQKVAYTTHIQESYFSLFLAFNDKIVMYTQKNGNHPE